MQTPVMAWLVKEGVKIHVMPMAIMCGSQLIALLYMIKHIT